MSVGDAGYYPRNHLFGTFTAAKERVIKVGRALSNATAKSKLALASCEKDTGVAAPENAPGRRRRKRKKRRQKKSKAHCVDTGPTVKSLPQTPRNNNRNMLDVSPTLCTIEDRDTTMLPANHCNDKKQSEGRVSRSHRSDNGNKEEHEPPGRPYDMNNMTSLDNRIPRKKPGTS
jgi:hypothetical protein